MGLLLSLREKMSTARLLINKFEDGSNFKSLCVTFPDEDDGGSAKFTEWMEGIVQQKKEESEKSSRLVVKIVSGEVFTRVDLETCSKEINKGDDDTADTSIFIEPIDSNKREIQSFAASSSNNARYTKTPIDITQLTSYNLDYTNPLEQSLQKVKENNARIMESIHLLDRTLNYTKKKEIMDIISPKSIRTFPCNTCGKCFVYETGLRRHYALRHAISEVQPRWQNVWTCIQCFQVWPRQDQAVLHSTECCKSLSDGQEFVREIKTSLLMQCEFCEKVFTSIPRLLKHSKIHATDKNYECVPCGFAFVSYKLAEHHWPLCPWLKAFYSFSLPKMLLCNACDRKFRNYEHLYNHRYKMGHFMTKTPSISATTAMRVMVYQCELCGQWYNSMPQMISHRSQNHHAHDTGISNTGTMAIGNSQNYVPAVVNY